MTVTMRAFICAQLNMLLGCQLFQGQWETWREEQPVACLKATGLQCVLGGVSYFPRLGWCVRGRLFWRLSVETRFACCRPGASLRYCS